MATALSVIHTKPCKAEGGQAVKYITLRLTLWPSPSDTILYVFSAPFISLSPLIQSDWRLDRHGVRRHRDRKVGECSHAASAVSASAGSTNICKSLGEGGAPTEAGFSRLTKTSHAPQRTGQTRCATPKQIAQFQVCVCVCVGGGGGGNSPARPQARGSDYPGVYTLPRRPGTRGGPEGTVYMRYV